jgi:hypothetical protein
MSVQRRVTVPVGRDFSICIAQAYGGCFLGSSALRAGVVVTDRTRADSRNILHLLKPSSTGTAGGRVSSPSSSSIFPAGGCPSFRRPRLTFRRLRIPASKQKTAAFKATAKTTFTARCEGTDVYAPSRSGGKIVAVYAVATVVMANYYGIPGERRRTYR